MGGGVPAAEGHERKTPQRIFIDASAGAIAGAVARVLTGPFDVVKIRFQVQLEPIMGAAVEARSKYTGFRQALTTILREEGIQVRRGPRAAGRPAGGGGLGHPTPRRPDQERAPSSLAHRLPRPSNLRRRAYGAARCRACC
jgi:hypothetical protein